MAQTVTIPKSEYKRLKEVEKRLHMLEPKKYLELATEDVKEYAHPDRIRRSLQAALKKYPRNKQ